MKTFDDIFPIVWCIAAIIVLIVGIIRSIYFTIKEKDWSYMALVLIILVAIAVPFIIHWDEFRQTL